MIDELLKVLRLEQTGKKRHANQIEKIYKKNIAHHKCRKCYGKSKMDQTLA